MIQGWQHDRQQKEGTTLRIMDAFMDAWRSVCVSVALSALATSRGVPAVVTRASRSLSSAA